MVKIEIKDFLNEPILRENSFREKIAAHNWEQYAGERVLIQGCSDIIIPTWAYLVVVANLVPHADKITFGEQKSRIPIFDKPTAS
jgi:hypothetical protein